MASKRTRPKVLRLVGGSETHSTTSAWNDLFDGQRACLVRATLADGRTIAGLYDERSVAAYSERVADLYLSERWELDADRWFIGPAARSLGLWLSSESIVSLEFYEIPKIRG